MRILGSTVLALLLLAPDGDGRDPLTFFRPTVVLEPGDVRALKRGMPVVRVLPTTGREVAVFTAIGVDGEVTVERAGAWLRHVELLRENRDVIASQRLSAPPRLSDFDRLVLDDEDLEDIRRCVPGRCGVKLAAEDMEALTRVATAAGSDWKPRVQQAFRQRLFRRVLTFTTQGHAGLDDIVDKKRPSSPSAALAPVVEHTVFLGSRLPDVAARIVRCASEPQADAESFMYWSNERLGGRPVITVTHVTLFNAAQPGVPLLMVGTQCTPRTTSTRRSG